jgi:FKBP-type peptidyl-prolyl cis-trans isomerase FkpA
MISGLCRRSVWFAAVSLVAVGSAGCDFGHATPTSPDQSNVQFSTTDLTVGTGAAAASGNTVSTTYAIWLYSDTAADHKGSQLQGGTPPAFVIGSNTLIKGYEMAIEGMAVGGVRRVIVPPSLAFGTSGDSTGAIPANAALVFEIQLNSLQ